MYDMHKVIDIDRIKLRSVNKKYNRNFTLTAQYKVFKQILFYEIKKPKVEIKPPYVVHIYLETYLDIDNPLKPILDVLEGSIINNDRYIEKLIIDKIPGKKGRDSSIKVFVGTLC